MSATVPSVSSDDPVAGVAGRAAFLDLVQGLDAIVWEMDAQSWRFTFVSDRAEHILGYPVRRWLEEPTFWQDALIHPDDRDWAVDFCVNATNEARDHEFHYRARHADGRTVWLKDVVRVVRGEDGAARLLRGVMVDVTREREAEARLVQQANLERERTHLALALDAGRMGSWEWDIAAGRVHWSPEEERLYGLPVGSFDGTVESYVARIHPDDREVAWRLVEEALARRAEAHHVTHRILHVDGTVRWLDSHGRFIYDADGRPLRLVGVSMDVTDRMLAQRERERQVDMLAAVDAGAWYCDLPFAELRWDRKVKEHFWLPADARVTIETFYARLHPDDRDRTREAIERSIDARVPYDIEYRTVAPSDHPRAGAVRWVRAIGYTAYSAAGQPIRFDGITVDVTSPKQVAEQLAASEQRYELAARATSNAIWDWDLLTNGVTWSPGVSQLFGYAADAVDPTADWWYEHIHPDDRDRVVAGIHAVIDEVGGAVAWREEYRFRRADGMHASIVDRGYVARDAMGRAVRMIGAMEDVSAQREVEEALRYQHYITDTITSNATAALFMMDADGHCTFMNPAAVAMTGFTHEEIRHLPLHYAIHHHHPDGSLYPMAECPIDRALPENFDVRAHEDVFIRKDGTFFPVLCAASPIFEAGRPVGTVVEVRDVTEERRRERALRESEARFTALANATGQYVWTNSADGKMLGEQRGWSRLTGQSQAEYEGLGWAGALHPDDRAHTVEVWNQAVATRSRFEIEHRVRRHDGEYRYFWVRAIPIGEEEGAVREWVGIHTDITERKAIEAARDAALAEVRHERARLQEVFTQAPSAISVSEGPEHRIVTVNAAYLEMVGSRPVLGRRVRDAFPEIESQGFLELLDRVYATGEPFAGREVPARIDRDADGVPEEYVFDFTYQPLRDATGRITGILTHAVEVTDQVRARAEVEAKAEELTRLAAALERSNRELDQFAYVASHDLKAPLRGIANLTQWIEEDLGERVTGDSREHMRLLKGRVHRMEALIDGILTYSRAARVQARPEPVDTGTLLAEVVDLLAPPPGVIEVESGMPTVQAERVPLQQVFINLLGNALKHGRADAPHVMVGWTERAGEKEFFVRDNGQGIAPEFHERIWGIFQTLEARDKVEGTGIGLAVVKKIVESRGGRVWVESARGEGATFRFTWPANVQP